MLQVEVSPLPDLSATDFAAWADFRERTPAFRSPLLSPDFALAVAAVRDDAAVAVVRRRGQAVAFLAHHRRPGGLARPIGAPWSDYQALVSEPDPDLDGVEILRAAGLCAYRFSGLVDPWAVFGRARAEAHESFVIAPPQSGSAYWEALRAASPKRFKNMRRLEHKLAREQGAISFGPDEEEAAFRALVGWKREQLRRSGLHDVLQPAWAAELMTGLFHRREGALQGLLLTLRVGGRPVAGHFGVRMGNHFHPWIAAFDPAFGAYSPGLTLLSEAVRAMPGLGLATYDLSGGSEHYKRPFASERVPVLEGVARTRPTLDLIPRRGVMRRVQRRLDHIAAAELSMAGRLQGVAAAVAGSSRRLAHQAPED